MLLRWTINGERMVILLRRENGHMTEVASLKM